MSDDNGERLRRAWRDGGEIVVTAIAGVGPNAGAAYMSVTPRAELMAAIVELREKPPAEIRRLAARVATAVRAAVTRPVGPYDPTADQDLLADLVILFAIRLVSHPAVAADAGLLDLLLAIDPDEAFPWEQRGKLDPAFTSGLGIDTRPIEVVRGARP